MRARRAAISVVLLSFANVVSRLTFAVIGIWLTRFLGASMAGLFFTAYAFVGLFAVIPDFGISPLVVREGARRPSETSRFYGTGLGLFLISGSLIYLFMVGTSKLVGYPPIVVQLIAILSVVIIVKAGEQVCNTILQLKEKLHITAIVQVFAAGGGLFLIYRATRQQAGLIHISLVLLGVGVASALAMLVAGVSQCRPRFSLATAKYLVKEAYLFGISGLLANCYLWSGVVILSFMRSEADVGQYSAAFRLISVLYMLPYIVFIQVLAPMMFAWAKTDKPKLVAVYKASARYLLAVGMAIAVGMFVLSDLIIPLIYTDEFSPAAIALAIICWAVPLRFFAAAASTVLTVTDHLRLKIRLQATFAAVSIALSATFTYFWGYVGTAVATVATEALLALVYPVAAGSCLYRLDLFRDLKLDRLLIAAVFLGVVTRVLEHRVPISLVVFLGAACYIALMLILGILDEADLRLFKRIMHARREG